MASQDTLTKGICSQADQQNVDGKDRRVLVEQRGYKQSEDLRKIACQSNSV